MSGPPELDWDFWKIFISLFISFQSLEIFNFDFVKQFLRFSVYLWKFFILDPILV